MKMKMQREIMTRMTKRKKMANNDIISLAKQSVLCSTRVLPRGLLWVLNAPAHCCSRQGSSPLRSCSSLLVAL